VLPVSLLWDGGSGDGEGGSLDLGGSRVISVHNYYSCVGIQYLLKSRNFVDLVCSAVDVM